MAMSYLVYPGATHKRFEHSLGVMELAGRVFDVVTAQDNISHDSVRRTVLNIPDDEKLYWRKVLRMAALCHDIGHLPFSHAAEKELLPESKSHESITSAFILNGPMSEIWTSMTPMLNPMDVAKVSVGQEVLTQEEFTDWERLLHEIIGGEAFGVDRMDYLLRDSHHAGVAYGRFDHYRLIEAMRILPASEQSDSLSLGIESGGIHSAEALLLARYFMFMQVYYHHVRVAYDMHLEEFLQAWLPGGHFPETWDELRFLTDNRVLAAISDAAMNASTDGHRHAKRIVNRGHFRRVYTTNPEDRLTHEEPVKAIADACIDRYGIDNVLYKSFIPRSDPVDDFPVIDLQNKIESSRVMSVVLRNIPIVDTGFVLVDPDYAEQARSWLQSERSQILTNSAGGG